MKLPPVRFNFSQTALWVTLRTHALHPLWWFVLVIWGLVAVLLLKWLPDLESRYNATVSERQILQVRLLDQASTPAYLQKQSATNNLQRFKEILGEPRYVEQQLKSLFAIASDLGLRLPHGQYKLACEDNIDFCTYRIVMPIEGSYVRVKTFVDQVLRAIPFASVDEVSFLRESVSDSEVQARLRISVYTSTSPSPRPRRGGGEGS